MTPKLSVALAVHGNATHLSAWLDALAPQVAAHAECECPLEVVVCHSDALAAGLRERCDDSPWLRSVACAADALVPELWRDGIEAAVAERVALAVVDCLPEAGWLAALLAADLETYSAIGGAIDCDGRADGVGLAIYLLRYARYARPFVACETFDTADLPGDNAVYDRAALLPLRADCADGFWEPEIHASLLREGHRLLRDPAIAVLHRNAYPALEFAGQRVAHGRRFGRQRALAMSPARRIVYLMLSPAVPLILGIKVVARALARRELRRSLLRAAPALGFFLLAWGAGEMDGVFQAVASGGAASGSRPTGP